MASFVGLPIVAVVGRPNVGKSTLFNRIVGERTVVVDTGGLDQAPGDVIEVKVQEQARLAIDEADVIVFVVDAATGLTPADLEAAELLRLSKAPVLVAPNKAD